MKSTECMAVSDHKKELLFYTVSIPDSLSLYILAVTPTIPKITLHISLKN
jgi:hypothetical protein